MVAFTVEANDSKVHLPSYMVTNFFEALNMFCLEYFFTVTLIERTYEKGVRLKPKEMDKFEAQVQRLSCEGDKKTEKQAGQ